MNKTDREVLDSYLFGSTEIGVYLIDIYNEMRFLTNIAPTEPGEVPAIYVCIMRFYEYNDGFPPGAHFILYKNVSYHALISVAGSQPSKFVHRYYNTNVVIRLGEATIDELHKVVCRALEYKWDAV